MKEFADVMKAWAPKKRRQLENFFDIKIMKDRKEIQRDKEIVKDMTYDEEMDYYSNQIFGETNNTKEKIADI